MKTFQWKAKNEKILYYSTENMFYYVYKDFLTYIVIFGLSLFVAFIIYLVFENILFSMVIIFLINFVYILYKWYLHHKTYVIVTNKRILKFVRNGLFSEHMKELKLDQLNEVSSAKVGFVEKLFKLGNIKVVGKDKENVIWFKWIKYPQEVVLYISRLRDYVVFERPDYKLEDLIEFKPKKERK